MKKLISDFPLQRWLDAAKCDECQTPYMVIFTFIDAKKNVGDIQYKCEHSAGCPQYDFEGSGVEEGSDMAGWEYGKGYMQLNGKIYPGYSSVLNKAPCMECGKMVLDIPLIMWSNDRLFEVHFCFPCARSNGILDRITANKS